jgi:hypothetical protein
MYWIFGTEIKIQYNTTKVFNIIESIGSDMQYGTTRKCIQKVGHKMIQAKQLNNREVS